MYGTYLKLMLFDLFNDKRNWLNIGLDSIQIYVVNVGMQCVLFLNLKVNINVIINFFLICLLIVNRRLNKNKTKLLIYSVLMEILSRLRGK